MRIRNIFAIAAAVFLMSAAEASAELIFEENFESPDWAEKWTGSGVISDKASLSGEKALFWDAMNTMYEDSGKTAGNYVYEMWIYDTVADVGMNNGGCMMFGAMYEKGGYAHIGFKSNAWNGQYLYGNKIDGEDIQTTDVRRSPGWHQFIVDMTEPKNAKFYVDGVLVKQKGIAAPENIKGLFIRNPWNAGGGYHIDDVRVWENIDEVPKYKNAEFAEGDTTSVKIAEPEFAVNFKEAMNTETFEENIELKDKSGNMVELEITKADEYSFTVIPKEELSYETEYILTLKENVRTKRFNSKLPAELDLEFTTEPNPFQIFDYGFKDENGKIITEYTGGKLIFSAGFTNSQEKEIPVTLFYMLYEVIDGKPRHVSGASKSMVLTNNYEPVILECLPVEMPDDKEYILKGFLWSGFDEKAVIRDSVVINKK